MLENQVQDELQKDLDNPNAVIEKRRIVREHYRFLTIKKRLFIIGIIISLLIIVAQYFLSDISNVTKVYINGNYYLPSNYIQSISEVDTSSKYLFVVDYFTQNNIEKDPFIKSAKVSHIKHGMIQIDVEEEKMVAYRMDDGFEILLGNGSYTKATDDLVQIISSLPLVVGFLDENAIKTLADYLGDVDHNVIENISEIHRYEMSYDENMVRILMRDGNNIFTSFYSLDTLNNYYRLLPNIEDKPACIFVDEISKQVYTSNCPWQSDEPKSDVENEQKEDEEVNNE